MKGPFFSLRSAPKPALSLAFKGWLDGVSHELEFINEMITL